MSDQIYREQLLDHFKNPRHSGRIPAPTGEAELKNLSCGDEVKCFIEIQDTSADGGQKKIKDLGFEAEGCAICVASASILSEFVIGKTVEEIKTMQYDDIEKLIGITLSPSRIKCAHLSLLTLQKAIGQVVF